MKRKSLTGAKVFKPRREFRAWLIYRLNSLGANLPTDPTYSQLQSAVDRYLRAAA